MWCFRWIRPTHKITSEVSYDLKLQVFILVFATGTLLSVFSSIRDFFTLGNVSLTDSCELGLSYANNRVDLGIRGKFWVLWLQSYSEMMCSCSSDCDGEAFWDINDHLHFSMLCWSLQRFHFFVPFEWSTVNIDYRCEDRKTIGELRGDIGAIR
jgi:hypothetical protein